MKRSLCVFIVLLLMLPSMAGCSGQTTVPDSQLELLIADALSGKGRSVLEEKSALERAMDYILAFQPMTDFIWTSEGDTI